jgi:hypothetical protein
MVTFSKFKSATIEGGKRILKVLQFGVKTAKECGPFGFDSQPLADFTAIYSDTSNKGESVIIGYINKHQVAEAGGSRMYALGSSGEVVSWVYVRASGDVELNGSEFSAVRFQNLKTATDASDNLINAELAKIAAAIASLGGTYTPGSITTDLTSSESETVKIK